jgi:hypothetical protein
MSAAPILNEARQAKSQADRGRRIHLLQEGPLPSIKGLHIHRHDGADAVRLRAALGFTDAAWERCGPIRNSGL